MEDVQGLAGLANFDSSRQKLAHAAWLGIETPLCHSNAIYEREIPRKHPPQQAQAVLVTFLVEETRCPTENNGRLADRSFHFWIREWIRK